MSESQLNASAQLGLSVLNQGGVSDLLGLGGPPRVALGVVLPIEMLFHRIWQRVSPFWPRRLFGHW